METGWKFLAVSGLLAMLAVAGQARGALKTEKVQYKAGETVMDGYLAYDDSAKGPRPGVLVVHEWWGLNDFTKHKADQLAEMGYVAFAADMYGKGVTTTDPQEAARLAGEVRANPAIARQRARAALDVLAHNDRVDPKRIAAIGFCFGGTVVLELAYSGADIAGVVTFHGGLVPPKPEEMKNIKARILVLHGADDQLVTPEQVAAFQEAMRKSGADWQMILYGGAMHSFTNPDADKVKMKGIGYNEKAARRSWQAMQLFFREIFAEPGAQTQKG